MKMTDSTVDIRAELMEIHDEIRILRSGMAENDVEAVLTRLKRVSQSLDSAGSKLYKALHGDEFVGLVVGADGTGAALRPAVQNEQPNENVYGMGRLKAEDVGQVNVVESAVINPESGRAGEPVINLTSDVEVTVPLDTPDVAAPVAVTTTSTPDKRKH